MNIVTRIACSPPGVAFFDTVADAKVEGYDQVRSEPPAGWRMRDGHQWVLMQHEDGQLPPQGWKVHVSATIDSSTRVLDRAYRYLTERTTWTFKFIRSPQDLYRRGSKYGDRSASGKFITIYPPDLAALERCLTELGAELAGEPGPYLLSDLRWEQGPLYVRYGGFVERTRRGPSGETEYLIETPDGALVPDRRGVAFRVPEWVAIPELLQPAIDARNSGTMSDFPYRVAQALHFSNAGGIYRAHHAETGEEVVLREARPHAGEDLEGLDAVGRLVREEAMLERLRGLPGIPRLIERRVGHEHTYLAREYVDGRTLASVITENPATVGSAAGEGAHGRYRETMLALLAQVEEALTGIHGRGVVFGDLQPSNILVRDDGSVVFIDFETASLTSDFRGQAVATPGFMAPVGTLGQDVDRFALGVLKLTCFWPVPTLFGWHPDVFDRIVHFVQTAFDLPDEFIAGALADIDATIPEPRPEPLHAGNATVEAPRWPQTVAPEERQSVCDDIAAGIVAAATPERRDRLFPGDAPTVHEPDSALDLRCGAAGILWALHRAGAAVPDAHIDWLVREATGRGLGRTGLFDGLAGVAWALDALGRRETAIHLVGDLLTRVDDLHDVTYGTGLSGVGWVLARLGQDWGDGTLIDAAVDIADRLATSDLTPRAAGLMSGSTGAAVLWEELRRSGHSEDRWRSATVGVLAREVGLLTPLDQVAGDVPGLPDPTTRTMLFSSLAYGGGTAIVARRYLAEGGPDPDGVLGAFADSVVARSRGSRRLEAGLFQGDAGRLAVDRALGSVVGDDDLGALGLFSVGLYGHSAFFGGSAVRLSADLSTGSAGVLSTLVNLAGGELVPGILVPER